MIHMVMSRAKLELGIEHYLKNRGTSIQKIVSPLAYETLFEQNIVPTGTWIFGGLCTLTPVGRTLASGLHAHLVSAGCRVLNDPMRSLRRFDLLTKLYDAGVNQFRAVRAADYRGGMRFPLFIRNDAQHHGSISPLLHSDAEVRRELFSLRLRGEPIDDLLVVEFRDLSIDGVFRKFSAFRVGDKILSRHHQVSSKWMLKSEAGDRTLAAAEAECTYIETNPHEELLAPLFEMANIEYGRMDYGFRDGRVEVWEINTAPTLGRNPYAPERAGDDAYRTACQPTFTAYHGRFCRAMEAVDSHARPSIIPTEFDRSALAAWRQQESRRSRRESVVRRLRSVAGVPGIRFAWRSFETAGRRMIGA